MHACMSFKRREKAITNQKEKKIKTKRKKGERERRRRYAYKMLCSLNGG